MKCRFLIGILSASLCTTLVASGADEGASLYKAKCAACHGAGGEGKPAMKAPQLKGTSLEPSQIVKHITKGEANSKPPHNKGINGLTEDQAAAIADFVRSLK
jgi:mono/diheme cytochrome c family protein